MVVHVVRLSAGHFSKEISHLAENCHIKHCYTEVILYVYKIVPQAGPMSISPLWRASFAGTGLYKLISSDPAASSLSDENDNSANMSNNGT